MSVDCCSTVAAADLKPDANFAALVERSIEIDPTVATTGLPQVSAARPAKSGGKRECRVGRFLPDRRCSSREFLGIVPGQDIELGSTPGERPKILDLLFERDLDALPKRIKGRRPELIVGNAGADGGLIGLGYNTSAPS
jgi:hypothetical protein